MKLRLLLLLATVVVLGGCGNLTRDRVREESGYVRVAGTSTIGSVYRIVDKDAETACWLSWEGISCLPLSETDLDY